MTDAQRKSLSPGRGFEFGVLGPLKVLHDGDPVAIGAAKQRVLLASLLIDANRVVPVETLTARLWGETPPDGARNALQNYVMRLRRVLGGAGGSDPVLTRPQGYLIGVADGAVDLHRFDALVRRARAAVAVGEADRASALLREALGLWRGQPLSDVPSELLQREVVPALAERRLGAVELRIQTDLALGRHGDVLPELRELTAAHPLRERFWAQRMLALCRSGRQGEALQCYRTVGELLSEELGIDPGAELRELHRRLLAADPALAGSGPPSGGTPTLPGARAGDTRPAAGLPAEMTTFAGRERQLAEAQRLLTQARDRFRRGGEIDDAHTATTMRAMAAALLGAWAHMAAFEHGVHTEDVIGLALDENPVSGGPPAGNQ
ncbi:AfsR/SARP family transcriptional regulator [Streptosporangium roseum]|uniref:AfsR/SARP family transcriptional regulator n=1 Tax=Streptosporangium roseum TaxID=2001 RepID=UPI0004CDB349|nr:AfsR/SARP family transcriptional regulator [Streptosporangium roseum]